MGYSSTQKGYILYDLSSKKIFVSRDIVFKEDIFPFKVLKSCPESLFPFIDLPVDLDYNLPTTSSTSSSQVLPSSRGVVSSDNNDSTRVVQFVAH